MVDVARLDVVEMLVVLPVVFWMYVWILASVDLEFVIPGLLV